MCLNFSLNRKPLGPPLSVTHRQHTDFIASLERSKPDAELAPIPPAAYAVLRRLMVVEQTPTAVLRGKAGSARRAEGEHGWFVGYVEARPRSWFFATNVEIRQPSDARYRGQLTREALQIKGIFPP